MSTDRRLWLLQMKYVYRNDRNYREDGIEKTLLVFGTQDEVEAMCGSRNAEAIAAVNAALAEERKGIIDLIEVYEKRLALADTLSASELKVLGLDSKLAAAMLANSRKQLADLPAVAKWPPVKDYVNYWDFVDVSGEFHGFNFTIVGDTISRVSKIYSDYTSDE